MLKIAILAAALSLAPALAFADDPAPAGVPADVRDAGNKLVDWIDSFKGKTKEQVIAALGKDGVAGTWKFKGQDEETLTYKPTKHTKVRFYFFNGAVVKVALDATST